ncbi:MAG TPA: hypothetical protein VJ831_03825 [Jatrophihabitantaceae bacterium]|nr:hypothetical protein [Jatrophihabitantaceae bacterium]
MRPDPDQLLQSLRVSLNETVAPAVTDRWARYVATAMDLVLQHLQLRLAGELDALGADNADMAETLAGIASAAAAGSYPPHLTERLQGTLTGPAPNGTTPDLTSATESNEALRAQVVAVLRVLDEPDAGDGAEAVRDELHRLIRRQVDRIGALVTPLHMSFGPAVAS